MSVEVLSRSPIIKGPNINVGSSIRIETGPVQLPGKGLPDSYSILDEAVKVASAAFQKPELNAPDAVAEAERIFAIVKVGSEPKVNPLTKEGIVDEANHWLAVGRRQSRIFSQAEEVAQRAWENHIFTQAENVAARAPTGEILDAVSADGIHYEVVGLNKSISPSKVTEAKPAVAGSTSVGEIKKHPGNIQHSLGGELHRRREEKIKRSQSLSQESELIRKRYVVDERALGQVITEIRGAVKKAVALATALEVSLTGSLVSRFLPDQHRGNESEAVKNKGTDGSIEERKKAISIHGDYISQSEAEVKTIKEAFIKPPVKLRKEGEGEEVGREDILRVFKHHPIKPQLTESEEIPLTAVRHEVRTAPVIEDYPAVAAALAPRY